MKQRTFKAHNEVEKLWFSEALLREKLLQVMLVYKAAAIYRDNKVSEIFGATDTFN